MILLFLIALLKTVTPITSEEEYFGKYYTVNSNCEIEFILSEKGVTSLKIMNLKLKEEPIKHDYLGIYGSSLLFQINAVDENNILNSIKLLIVFNEGKFILASGYLLRTEYDDKNGKLSILQKSVLDMSYLED